MKPIKIVSRLTFLSSLVLLFACSTTPATNQEIPAEVEEPIVEVPEEAPPVEPEPLVTTASLYAIGDVLLHDSVYNAARVDDGYDFDSAFEQISPILSRADISIANQESMIGGSEIGLSSYPAFNSPYEIGDALKRAGIDLVTTANNHTLDRGVRAIENSIGYWNEIGMPYTGSFLSAKDKANIRTLTANDISFSFLAYTYGTNGVVPKQPYHVNYIDLAQMQPEIEKAEQSTDMTVVSLHFGTEYEPLPNEGQTELAQALADLGVDIIIGHHPHVLQPPAMLEGVNGNQTFVVYSLGNFLSGQQGDDRNTGGIIGIDVVKTIEDNSVTFELKDPMFYPTFARKSTGGPYEVVPLEVARPKLISPISNHMSQWLPQLKIEQ
ncbi:CapA family protein [Exiguobacterium marinum]|uniref:CapA family protein n=1 Tax=Exiguobacterium marinum TaxID=273528 RepID=A0ABY7WV01_9BACL|nr:CapA family protein [Exiguobacterium marinum]WDH74695.1 CapA family protein [Exiguobacterium marinum]